MKSARAILLLFLAGGFFMSCSNEEMIAATPVSEMQKLMAEKAFKMPPVKISNKIALAHFMISIYSLFTTM